MSSGAGGGGNSGGGGGDSFASARQAMTSNAAYSAPSKTSAPSNTGGGGDNNNYQDRIQRISTGVEPGFRPQDEQPFGLSKEEAFRQGRITKDQLETPAVLESQIVDERSPFQVGVDNVIDFYKQGGILGAGLRALSPMSEALQQKAMDFGLKTKINRLTNKKGSTVRENNIIYQNELADLRSDLDSVRSGDFKQSDYTAKYGSGDATNPLDASFNPATLDKDEQQNLQNLFTPELVYSVSGQTPQSSVAQQFFNNMNMTQNSSLSSDLQTDYNNAKTKVDSILGITPPSQQFGYSAQPYGLLSSTNMADNPFNIDYLKQRGLI